MTAKIAGQPSLVVLPFVYRDDDPKAEYQASYQEGRRFRAPDIPWDPPLLRSAAARHFGNRPAMVEAYYELTERFPDVAQNPTETIRKYFHFDYWVDVMLEGLDKASSAVRRIRSAQNFRDFYLMVFVQCRDQYSAVFKLLFQ